MTSRQDPLLVIGCPRSGTTLLLRCLARHEDLAWVSRLVDRHPGQPWLSALNRLHDVPVVGDRSYWAVAGAGARLGRLIGWSRPTEPWSFWEAHLPGFRDDDVAGPGDIVRAVDRVVHAHGGIRMLSKYTDLPRVTHIRAVFPQAQFVHIVRDRDATISSYHAKLASGAFGTLRYVDEWVARWDDSLRQRYRDDPTPMTFADSQCRYFIGEIRSALATVPADDAIEVCYEELVEDPVDVLARICTMAGLRPSPQMEQFARRTCRPGRNELTQSSALADQSVG